ncbi:MAG TPA: phage tail protein [Buttiauxella sp.]|jgi:hypothetical protein
MKTTDTLVTLMAGMAGNALGGITAQTLNRVASQAAKRATTKVASDERLPVKAVRRRARLQKATASKPRAILRINTRNMPAIRAGKVRVVKGSRSRPGGVYAGRHFIAGGFVRVVRYGPQILRRVGQARYGIEVVKFPLAGALKAAFVAELERADIASDISHAIKTKMDARF